MSKTCPRHNPFNFKLTATAATILLLVLFDAWLSFLHPLANAPTPGLDRSEVFNSIREYYKLKQAPDIVLLGSSVVTAPVMQADALYLQEPIPRMFHRYSEVLGNELSSISESKNQKVTVFCLATAGEMCSDAYFITRNILQQHKGRPQAIVYGIAPRDLQDNLMPGVDSTETFQSLANIQDAIGLLNSPNMSVERKANVLTSRIWALWRYRIDLKTYLVLRTKKLLEKICPLIVFDKYGETMDLKPRRKGQFPEEAKGVLKAFPGVALDHLSLSRTCSEYHARYNPLSVSSINTQRKYFLRLLELCKANQIKIIVVNMPLSTTNKSLMQSGFYQDYKHNLKDIVNRQGDAFVDLDNQSWDNNTNFVDGVHLNPEVSQSFLKLLATKISSCTALQL